MENRRHRVNVTQFLADVQAGLTDRDLMRNHGLDHRALEKVRAKLETKGLLQPDLGTGRTRVEPEKRMPTPTLARPTVPLKAVPAKPETGLDQHRDPLSICPQCGAQVDEKIFTCPECGHVLPGEERWSNPERDRGLLDRVHPLVLGCIIALPVALVVFYVFKGFLVSLQAASKDKKTKSVVSLSQSSDQEKTPRFQQNSPTASPIVAAVNELIGQEFISSVNEDYSNFVAGDRWSMLTRDEKIQGVNQLCSVLERSGIEVRFSVTGPSGEIVARGTSQYVDLVDRDGFTDSVARSEVIPTGSSAPGDVETVSTEAGASQDRRGSVQTDTGSQ